MLVEILDIGSGNVKSIQNWIERVNVPTRIVTKCTDIKSDFLVLPGVGSAGPYMDRMRKGSFDKAVIDHVNKGNKLVGICLGFQIMSNFTEEDGGVEGLGLLNAKVKRLEKPTTHNGWEKFNLKKSDLVEASFSSELKLTRKQAIDGRVFYNHEYGFVLEDKKLFSKPISNAFNQYSSIVVDNNIMGIQFHPEKSQQTGIDLISMIL